MQKEVKIFGRVIKLEDALDANTDSNSLHNGNKLNMPTNNITNNNHHSHEQCEQQLQQTRKELVNEKRKNEKLELQITVCAVTTPHTY